MIYFISHHIKSVQQLCSITGQIQQPPRLANQFESHSKLQKYGPSRRLSEVAKEVSKSNILVQTEFIRNEIIENGTYEARQPDSVVV